MSDPVAEAAAQLAALQNNPQVAEPTTVEVPNVPAVAAESATAPATAEGAGGAAVGEPASAAPGVMFGVAESDIASAKAGTSDLPNADASTHPAGAATDAAGDSPNGASVAVEPTTALGSASNAAGASITSIIGASSAEPPLQTRIAAHLEAIYQLACDYSVATETAATLAAATTKTCIGDILHRISNGMAVTEGELVTKLEALYRML